MIAGSVSDCGAPDTIISRDDIRETSLARLNVLGDVIKRSKATLKAEEHF